ncbi:MAG: DUF3883 domain-containing protein [Chloroflexi bacterium]|nr:DUF3883 domain-containing protein [Chloroflexota bacterium]
MIKLEDLKPGIWVRDLLSGHVKEVVTATQFENEAEVVFDDHNGNIEKLLLNRSDERSFERLRDRWSFDGDANLFKLASEAYRIDLTSLASSPQAINTSNVQVLPHQVIAVYQEMLPRYPLRFLLADDPGAGKTIMAGLLIRELISRGDVQKCLICVPGDSLANQWERELWHKFQLDFKSVKREDINSSPRKNPLKQLDNIIVTLNRARGTRNDRSMRDLIEDIHWDLIICDEAHRMSAPVYGKKPDPTQSYQLGRIFSKQSLHFLLMTATPHNGKEPEFQMFLQLLDPDRFGGMTYDSRHRINAADVMLRRVKEELKDIDGNSLFTDRNAETIEYELSHKADCLYRELTKYIINEFNRAESLGTQKKNRVGFALQILQRRFASSPKAIYESLKSRRTRLTSKLQESSNSLQEMSEDLFVQEELDDMSTDEREEIELESVSSITANDAVRVLLKKEIESLRELERQAYDVYQSNVDRKWEELCQLWQEGDFTANGKISKLIVFTEWKDTIKYLEEKFLELFQDSNAVISYYGGLSDREDRIRRFRDDPSVRVMVANDAAGEGLNLQFVHMMVNYDLPWNPNRLEQRFGRIHRIGQTEDCYMWNLVATGTVEGYVQNKLHEKIEAIRRDLGGKVYDVLGQVVSEASLRDLHKSAILEERDPAAESNTEDRINNLINRDHIKELIDRNAFAISTIDSDDRAEVREKMQRIAAVRLQPRYVKDFFALAFKHLGGTLKRRQREQGRYVIKHVPAAFRSGAQDINIRVLETYRRICFDKALIETQGWPDAELLHPKHPLLEATIGLILRKKEVLSRGAVLVDDSNAISQPRILLYVEYALCEAKSENANLGRYITRRLHFVEIDKQGKPREIGTPPYLDYRTPRAEEQVNINKLKAQSGFQFKDVERKAEEYVRSHFVPAHREEIEADRLKLVSKEKAAINERILQLRQYRESQELDQKEKRTRQLSQYELLLARQESLTRKTEMSERYSSSSVTPESLSTKEELEDISSQLNRSDENHDTIPPEKTLQQLKEVELRLEQKLKQLEDAHSTRVIPPKVKSAAFVVPASLLDAERKSGEDHGNNARDKKITENVAMQAVMDAEISLRNLPIDVSEQNLGYDIESQDKDGDLRFIEVKGRRADAPIVTLTKNELITALNCGDRYILALVLVQEEKAQESCYVRGYPFTEPDPSIHSVNYDLRKLMEHSTEPQ